MLKTLHVALEYQKGVGGIKTVTNGLLPALSRHEIEVSIITPFYDFFENFYPSLEEIGIITHTYKGVIHTSNIYRTCNREQSGSQVYHYLVRPIRKSPVARIFEVGDEKNIYLAFKHSEPQNRREYLNGAVASLVRQRCNTIPTFDIVQLHTWHTFMAACLIKEYANYYKNENLNPIPHIISIIHMLSSNTHGDFHNVGQLLASFSIPSQFALQFPNFNDLISPTLIKQIALGLVYSDCVTTVSQGLLNDLITGKGCGLDSLFLKLHSEGRLAGITNGISVQNWYAANRHNLNSYTFSLDTIVTQRKKLKSHIENIYPNLNSNKLWFLYVGRFAEEKGIDMLSHALDAIQGLDAHLVVMGIHVTANLQTTVGMQIEALKVHPQVLVIEDVHTQHQLGKYIRAACEFTLVPSHLEACGLVPMEALACASIPITSDVQGLPDAVRSLEEDFYEGTGFIYSDLSDVRNNKLKETIVLAAHKYLFWNEFGQLSKLLARLMHSSLKHDWDASPANEYCKLYERLMLKEVLTYEQIRTIQPLPQKLRPALT